MKTVILAGGFGTRIGEESVLRPKPMIPIGGQPILWHIMKYYSQFGHNEFILCCGYLGHIIKEYFANYYLHQSTVTFDFTDHNRMTIHTNVAEPWRVTLVETGLYTQTGGRVKRAAAYTGGEPFFLTYGDGVADVDLNALLRQHQDSGMLVTLTAVQPGGRFGVLDLEAGSCQVKGFREKNREDGGWVNGGFMAVQPEFVERLPDEEGCVLERTPLEELSRAGLLGAYRHHGFWKCMDTQRDREELEQLWRGGKAPWRIWEGEH